MAKRLTSSFPATEPMMSYVAANRLAEAGKRKRKVGRAHKLAEGAFALKLRAHSFYRSKNGGLNSGSDE